jgi:hypothetical protein
MASETMQLKLSEEQLNWLHRGGRELLRREVKKMLAAPQSYGVEVLRWSLLLPTDILVSILDEEGEGTRYHFDEDDPLADIYYRKNRDHFSSTKIAVEKGSVKDFYDLGEDEVYLRFDYRGDIRTVRQQILDLLAQMPPLRF